MDVKELAEDGTKIVDVNRGCYDTFAAIYDCPVPVISAVHGFCIGGGIGIAGSSDIVIASEDASFSLPEIDRGAHILWSGGHDLAERLTPHELDGEIQRTAAVPDIEYRREIGV